MRAQVRGCCMYVCVHVCVVCVHVCVFVWSNAKRVYRRDLRLFNYFNYFQIVSELYIFKIRAILTKLYFLGH